MEIGDLMWPMQQLPQKMRIKNTRFEKEWLSYENYRNLNYASRK